MAETDVDFEQVRILFRMVYCIIGKYVAEHSLLWGNQVSTSFWQKKMPTVFIPVSNNTYLSSCDISYLKTRI